MGLTMPPGTHFSVLGALLCLHQSREAHPTGVKNELFVEQEGASVLKLSEKLAKMKAIQDLQV